MFSVLVIDDVEAIRKSVTRLLKKKEYQVFEAESGPKALGWLSNNKPDIILLDIMMPGMNGLELCKIIRQDSRISDAYIILLSARAKTEDKVEGLDTGADDYISKPFDPQELFSRIETGTRTLKRIRGID